jgi:parallel beta-helix repeat protein
VFAENPASIAASIYDLTDSYTSTTLPTVDYLNFLNGPNGTPVSGNYLIGALAATSTTLTAGTTYDVVGTLIVPAAKSLTIPGGTVLRFHGEGSQLVVDGTLTVQGTSGNLAVLTSARGTPARGDWFGIRVRANGTLIEYAQIEWAQSGVYSANFAVTVRNSTIRNFEDEGLLLSGAGASASQIQNNLIDNLDDAVQCIEINNSSPTITGNTIANCSNGIYAVSNSSPLINGNNVIADNYVGIYVHGNSSHNPQPVVTGNTFSNNSGWNYMVTGYQAATNLILNATGNWWGTTDLTTISSKISDFTDSYVNPAGHPTVNFANPLDGPGGSPIAASYLFGRLTGNATWSGTSTHEVIGTVVVSAGTTLTVQPGAILKFHGPEMRIIVEGTLLIQGTSTNRVRLTSGDTVPARGAWHGVLVKSTATNTLIDYATFEWADRAIETTNANITVRRSVFREFAESGISMTGVTSSSLIEGNLFDNVNRSGTCIGLSGSSPAVTANRIYRCGYGLYLAGSSNPAISGNAIAYNGTGIYLYGAWSNSISAVPNPSITANDIFGNVSAQLELAAYGSSNPVVVNASGNYWGVATPLAGTHIKTGSAPATAVNFSGWSSTPLTGANAGTVVVSEPYISPNADSVKESTVLSGTLNQSASWTINVKSPSEVVVRSFTGSGSTVSANWDGRDSGGAALADGQYVLELEVPGSPVPQLLGAVSVVVDTIAPTTTINSPAASSTLQNTILVPVIGTATDAHFISYVLEYGVGNSPSSWTQIHTQTTSVLSSALGTWSVSSVTGAGGLASGPYTLRLRSTDPAGNAGSVSVPVLLDNLNLSGITFTNASFKPVLGESTTMGFSLSAPAIVALHVFPESGGAMIREITQEFTTAGAKTMSWDGRDSMGTIVPDEAYVLRLHATAGTRVAAYDPPNPPNMIGGGAGTIDTFFDAYLNDDFWIAYDLQSSARVRMTVTPSGGAPFYPINWKPFTAGVHSLRWNGRDMVGLPVTGSVNVYFDAPINLRPGSVITVGSSSPTFYFTESAPSDFLGHSSLSPKMDFASVIHSYDQQSTFTYYVDQDSYVTIKLLPPGISDPMSSEAVVVKASSLVAMDQLDTVIWNGYLPADTNNFVWSTEGHWTVIMQAQSVATGGVRTLRGSLYLAH